MSHPLIDQLRFTRSEWLRGLQGISAADASRHFGRMNCISWTVGHLAWQEHRYWLERAQGQSLYPQLNVTYAYGAPMSTPSFDEMFKVWQAVTSAADLLRDGQSVGQSLGSAMRRMTYHYWYHIGEIQAMRQMLDHQGLPEYVGDIEAEAPYRPE